jgi:hypothetical protein
VNVVREIYDFITGGSVAAPIGLVLAVAVALIGGAWQPAIRDAAFAGVVLATLAAASLERPS